MIRPVFIIFCVVALSSATVYAQTSPAPYPSTAPIEETDVTTGTVSDFTSGQLLVVDTDVSGSKQKFKFAKTVSYTTPDGRKVLGSSLKKGEKVRVHYIPTRYDMYIDQVVVLGRDGVAPD